MKVFLSSMGRMLRAERDELIHVLPLMDHEVIHYEDWPAADSSSRVACMRKVAEADVFILILGPLYGEKMPDSNFSPTEEEYREARRLGKTMYVFKKTMKKEDVEPAQLEFIARVGAYIGTNMYKEFETVKDLTVQVKRSLDTYVPVSAHSLTWRRISEMPYESAHPARVSSYVNTSELGTVLELHLIPTEHDSVPTIPQTRTLANTVTSHMRDSGFVAAADAVEPVVKNNYMEYRRPSQQASRRGATNESHTNSYRGVRLYFTGELAAYLCLPTNLLATVISEPELCDEIHSLLEQLIPLIQPDVTYLALTVCLIDGGLTRIGTPEERNSNTGGSSGFSLPDLILPADMALSKEDLQALPRLAAEALGARLALAIQNRVSQRNGRGI